MMDRYGRDIDYMRISITDRCNLRCRYCMPPEGVQKLDMAQILSFEEILDICRAAADLGVCKFKVTGGEPLVRLGCSDLIRQMKAIPGVRQVTLTTNGQLLGEHIPDLAEAGIDGINVSLDSLQEDRYEAITRGGRLSKVLEGIDLARDAGIRTKVNCVLQRGFNEDEAADFAALAFGRGIDVRFIELMPVGFGDPDQGIPGEDVLQMLRRTYPLLELDDREHGNGPAIYYRLPAKSGAIGFISAMHGRFCGSCNRIRLTSTGQVKPCLCYEETIDLRRSLRGWEHGTDVSEDAEQRNKRIKLALQKAIERKPAGHCFEQRDQVEHRSMMEIGG